MRDWRETLLRQCGPGVLGGITFRTWLKLLREEGATIDPSRVLRAISITGQSLKNARMLSRERRKYEAAFKDVVIEPPLFILGHWRSGTTYLHELISKDDRLGYPNSYQVSFPHTFLCTEERDARRLSFFVPRHRPMDAMALTLASPQEDEFALCASSLKSPCMAWVFPRQKEKFEKFLTFRAAEKTEIDEWGAAFIHFLKKVQWRCRRPLVLKSPPHTARIRLLLALFPEARFVHIHRDPYAVFQSSRRTFRILFDWHGLQRPPLGDLDDWVLRQYKQLYEAFFEERDLIPNGRFHEVAFERLEQDPAGEVRRLYEALNLGGFDTFEPKLQSYVDSLSGYRKNSLPGLSRELRERIGREWKAAFDEWGYSLPTAV
jgi:omega-hydroxy-beta-dihydromenaquinone-9 sulfotransferase